MMLMPRGSETAVYGMLLYATTKVSTTFKTFSTFGFKSGAIAVMKLALFISRGLC